MKKSYLGLRAATYGLLATVAVAAPISAQQPKPQGKSEAIGFLATADKFERVLAILEDMLVNPSFPAPALERLRARRMVALTQQKDQTPAIAARVFPKVLYTDAHPYGRMMTEQSLQSI